MIDRNAKLGARDEVNYRFQMYIVTSNPNRKSSKLGLVHFIGILRETGKNPTLRLEWESIVHLSAGTVRPSTRFPEARSARPDLGCQLWAETGKIIDQFSTIYSPRPRIVRGPSLTRRVL